jgi:hypothetical protein
VHNLAVPRFAINLAEWFKANAEDVGRNLTHYYAGQPKKEFTGRWFDEFAAIGDPNQFGATDVIAVEALSVEVRSEAAAKLLVTETERFNSLLRQIPRALDIWDAGRLILGPGSPADDLHAALKDLPDVGPVTAGKLMAAKRPRLIPIFDERVEKLLEPRGGLFWVSMHDELSDKADRAAIAEVCKNAPPHVVLLRRIDVAIWMAGGEEA